MASSHWKQPGPCQCAGLGCAPRLGEEGVARWLQGSAEARAHHHHTKVTTQSCNPSRCSEAFGNRSPGTGVALRQWHAVARIHGARGSCHRRGRLQLALPQTTGKLGGGQGSPSASPRAWLLEGIHGEACGCGGQAESSVYPSPGKGGACLIPTWAALGGKYQSEARAHWFPLNGHLQTWFHTYHAKVSMRFLG